VKAHRAAWAASGCIVAAWVIAELWVLAPEFLNKYQTFIVGLLAFFGAIGTIYMINRQIAQATEIELDRRNRQHLAARAMLPAALSSLCSYARDCAIYLRKIRPISLQGPARLEEFGTAVPAIPTEAIGIIREFIEFAEYKIAEHIADLVAKLQVQQSRLAEISYFFSPSKLLVQKNVDTFLMDALEIHAMCGELFPYARRQTQEPPRIPNTSDIQRSAFVCGIYDIYPDIEADVRRRFPEPGAEVGWKPNEPQVSL
jgi:hypothetical protein